MSAAAQGTFPPRGDALKGTFMALGDLKGTFMASPAENWRWNHPPQKGD